MSKQLSGIHDDATSQKTSSYDGSPTEKDSLLPAGSSKKYESDEPLVLTMDQAIDRLGYGRFQVRLLWAAGLCLMSDGVEILLLSFLTLVLRSTDSGWSLNSAQVSSITASVFAGALVGTLVLGRLADSIGRKPVFTLTAAIIAIFGFVTGIAPNYMVLLSCRFLVGFGVGGLTVPFDSLTEFLPNARRGHNLLLVYYFWCAGTMLVVLLAWFTIGQGRISPVYAHEGSNQSSKDGIPDGFWEGWRVFVIACAIPCIISTFYGLAVVPESPRWLVTTKNNPERALDILRKAATINGSNPDTLFPSNTQLQREVAGHDGEKDGAGFAKLFTSQWRRTTLYLWGAWIGFAFLYYGGVITTTLVFSSSRDVAQPSSSYHFDYQALFISNAAELVGTILMVLAVDSFGRTHTQCATYFLSGALALILCILASSGHQNHHRVAMVSLAFGTRMLLMISTCTTWLFTSELLPTDIRGTGHSVANAVARIGGFVCPYVVAPSTSVVTIGFVMFGMACFTTFCCWNLPETRGLDLGSANTKAQRNDVSWSEQEAL